MFPLILIITLQDRKTLFCIFLSLRDLPGLKLTWDFWSINILSRETPDEEEVNKTRRRGRMSTGGAGPLAGRATHARWGLEHPSSSPDAQLDLKTPIYIPLIVWVKHPVGNPKRKVWGAQQQVSLSCETKVYQTGRRKPNFKRWCLLASRHSGQRRQKMLVRSWRRSFFT
jgi:hypothetical protein